jgi:hypothetical protein
VGWVLDESDKVTKDLSIWQPPLPSKQLPKKAFFFDCFAQKPNGTATDHSSYYSASFLFLSSFSLSVCVSASFAKKWKFFLSTYDPTIFIRPFESQASQVRAQIDVLSINDKDARERRGAKYAWIPSENLARSRIASCYNLFNDIHYILRSGI